MSARPESHMLENAEAFAAPAQLDTSSAGRRDFLRRGALAGGGMLALGTFFDTLASPALAADKSPENDIAILNYALTLEYLEAEFYAQADKNKAYGKNWEFKVFTQLTAKHEAAHVAGLKAALGSKAVAKPKFDFGDAVKDQITFLNTAKVLEDTGVSAYSGQVANISNPDYLVYATSILTVEARHAAWVRFLLGGGNMKASTKKRPAPVDFDVPATKDEVLKAVTGTGFIVG